jgi:hypothetical protein
MALIASQDGWQKVGEQCSQLKVPASGDNTVVATVLTDPFLISKISLDAGPYLKALGDLRLRVSGSFIFSLFSISLTYTPLTLPNPTLIVLANSSFYHVYSCRVINTRSTKVK